MAEKITTISAVSDETKEKIRKLSAESLPINPSAKGMKPDEVKKAFYEPIIGGSTSILKELQRIIGEANAVYGYILGTIGDMEGYEETKDYENIVDAIADVLVWSYDHESILSEHEDLISEIQKEIDNNEALKTKAKSFLEAINENYDKIVANEQYRKMLANALKGKVIGNPVTFNDVDISPLAHDVNCRVRAFSGSIANGVDVIVTTGSESTTYTTDDNGRVTIPSVTKDTVITSIPDVVIEAEYNVDTNVIPRDYVKKTDYAFGEHGGIVRADLRAGTRMMSGGDYDGVLDVCAANKSLIDGRTPRENPLYSLGESNRHTIVPSNLDYAVKAALSDCRIDWTDEEKTAAKVLLGIWANDFQTIQNEGEKITLPIGVNRYAQISEIHGMDSDYNVYSSYYNAVKNYPIKIVADNNEEDVVFELPNDLLGKLTDFGVRGNYIYFDDSKVFYHQANRIFIPLTGEEYANPPLEDGEEVIHNINDTMVIIKLATPIVTDISYLITANGIINMGDAEYLTVIPLETEESVEAMVRPEGVYGDYRFNFPTVKIIVEA